MVLLVSLLAAICAPSILAHPAPSIPLRGTLKRYERLGPKDDEWRLRHRSHIERRYGGAVGSDPIPRAKRQASGSSPVFNYHQDVSYYTEVQIGTPAKTYSVVMDTGSSDLWFASASCQPGCANSGITTFYSSSGSSSFNGSGTSFTMTYNGGDVSGTTAAETVTVAGMTVQKQAFGIATTFGDSLLSPPTSGLFGLAWGTIANLGTPWWQNAANGSPAWAQPLFAIALSTQTAAAATEANAPGGSFTLGTTDPSVYTGTINYIDIPSGAQSWWVIPVSQVNLNGATFQLGTSYAIVDTGTTLIGGPQDIVTSLYANIPGVQPGTGANEGYYFYDCTQTVTMSFTFGAITYTMPSTAFGMDVGSGLCMGALFTGSFGNFNGIAPSWILGDSFLKNVYTVYRYNPPSIGFAQLADAAALAAGGATITGQGSTATASFQEPVAETTFPGIHGTITGFYPQGSNPAFLSAAERRAEMRLSSMGVALGFGLLMAVML